MCERLGLKEAVQGNIDLVVLRRLLVQLQEWVRQGVSDTHRRDFARLEGADDAVDLELPVHVGLLLLDVGGFVDVWGHDG